MIREQNTHANQIITCSPRMPRLFREQSGSNRFAPRGRLAIATTCAERSGLG
jgi:hypothetical protein